MKELRKSTSFSIPASVHRGLDEMAKKHGRSMSKELDYWYYLAKVVDEATEPTQKVIERIVEERMKDGMASDTD